MALRILPNIRAFQHSSIKSNDSRCIADLTLIGKRLKNAGLLIYNEMTCTADDVILLNEDLLLIAGSVRNQFTKCVYEAPIFIKRSLSKQSLKLLEDRSITRILVLPRVITTANRNNLFTDSSLIQHILDDGIERRLNRKSSNYERLKRIPIKMSERMKYKNRTCLINTIGERYHINDDNRYLQITTHINRSLLATSNILLEYFQIQHNQSFYFIQYLTFIPILRRINHT